MQLKITTTRAQIALEHIPSDLKMTTEVPVLPLETQLPETEIRKTPDHLDIDLAQVWAEIGLKSRHYFDRHYRDLSRQAADAGTRRLAQEGDRLARLEQDNRAIANIARENLTDSAEINVALWPSRPPNIDYIPGKLKVKVKPGGLKSDYRPASVRFSFIWGKIAVYLAQKPEIHIEAELDERI